ncbi:hypothetical protein B0H16DRAFT_1740270 [Mycena metata]|uniref:Uncharacterized protein n=1 Tax=Mycena metata TaxID=1033252 RepID=A0AAD7HD36_9AGAR|nr:hypothetical protein B0H16DRAFT_1740270 [Mycena metata]
MDTDIGPQAVGPITEFGRRYSHFDIWIFRPAHLLLILIMIFDTFDTRLRHCPLPSSSNVLNPISLLLPLCFDRVLFKQWLDGINRANELWTDVPHVLNLNHPSRNTSALDDVGWQITPQENGTFLSQSEVDKHAKKMTCGLEVEEHFWPIRSQIYHGKLHPCKNTRAFLVTQARKSRQSVVLSRLTGELPSSNAERSSCLLSFLIESQRRDESLWQIALEIQAKDHPDFKDAIWKDRITIVIVVYEILLAKIDLDHMKKLPLEKATVQFILNVLQDAIATHADLSHLLRGGIPFEMWIGSRLTSTLAA